ncbi:hypothetical protein [Leifsonia shinshuensis]|uniref:Uncharacterized protein n=1 Tax=Leifsonia shinshuensis TaxID=150026 RepID=A0A853D4L4_9MICO|nr:hypothetical protein [Leifsonia shinshuensis]NYJ25575.1 hypothetical protein [Leifsonia shinshuensis]
MTETTTSTTAAVLATARRAALRPVLVLLGCFVALSAAFLGSLPVLAAFGVAVDIAIWIRGSFVLASAVLLLIFAIAAARGSRSALLRLRIIAPIVLAAIVVIVSIPGFLPDWVRLEQAVCGALVLPVAIIVNLPRTRALFPAKAANA